jgi:methionine sulfoxide reductase heme-binding subunit
MLRRSWVKIIVLLCCLAPAAWLARRFWRQDLTPNPLEFLEHFTGDWTIRFLVITLAITPLRKLLGQPDLIRFRRMTGLTAFFYGCLHFTTYLWFDRLFDVHAILKDVGKRPFITAGFTGFVLMVPLALTSTRGWIRRLGGRRWQALHRLVYASAVAGVVHYYWLVKSDIRLPLLYGSLVAVLLLARVALGLRSRWAAARPPVGRSAEAVSR